MVDRDILEAARDAFNERHPVGTIMKVKAALPHVKARRPPPIKRAIAAPAIVDGDAVWAQFEPMEGEPAAWPIKSLTWNA